jgi:hypothetical protein
MFRLVEANATTAGKLHLCDGAPPFFLNFRALNVLLREGSHFGFQIVAQEIEFVDSIFIGRVKCRFRGRQGKDQPAVTGIHTFEAEDVTKEGTVRIGVFSVKNHVSARNHFALGSCQESRKAQAVK